MSAKLVVIAGPDQGKTFPLAEGVTVTVGRADNAGARLGDNTVSRSHCTVTWAGGEATVKDCGSRYGTKVNGEAVTEGKLRPDDVIQLAQTRLRFECAAPAPKEAAAAGGPDA